MSLAAIPATVLLGVGLWPVPGVGPWVWDRGSSLVAGRRGRGDEPPTAVLRVVVTGQDRRERRDVLTPAWTVLRRAVFRGRTAAEAAGLLAVAVLLHHVRRTLWPNLGGGPGLHAAAEDWRLVLARPDVWLAARVAAEAGVDGWKGAMLTTTKWLADVAGSGCVWFAAAAADGGLLDTYLAHHLPPRLAATVVQRARTVATVAALVWLAACVEYAVARLLATAAAVYAVEAAATGTAAMQTAAWAPVLAQPLAAARAAWSAVAFAAAGAVPLLAAAVRHAARGRPALLLVLVAVAAGQWALLRYRARLYLCIEAGGFFVVAWWAAVATGVWASGRGVADEDDSDKKRQ